MNSSFEKSKESFNEQQSYCDQGLDFLSIVGDSQIFLEETSEVEEHIPRALHPLPYPYNKTNSANLRPDSPFTVRLRTRSKGKKFTEQKVLGELDGLRLSSGKKKVDSQTLDLSRSINNPPNFKPKESDLSTSPDSYISNSTHVPANKNNPSSSKAPKKLDRSKTGKIFEPKSVSFDLSKIELPNPKSQKPTTLELSAVVKSPHQDWAKLRDLFELEIEPTPLRQIVIGCRVIRSLIEFLDSVAQPGEGFLIGRYQGKDMLIDRFDRGSLRFPSYETSIVDCLRTPTFLLCEDVCIRLSSKLDTMDFLWDDAHDVLDHCEYLGLPCLHWNLDLDRHRLDLISILKLPQISLGFKKCTRVGTLRKAADLLDCQSGYLLSNIDSTLIRSSPLTKSCSGEVIGIWVQQLSIDHPIIQQRCFAFISRYRTNVKVGAFLVGICISDNPCEYYQCDYRVKSTSLISFTNKQRINTSQINSSVKFRLVPLQKEITSPSSSPQKNNTFDSDKTSTQDSILKKQALIISDLQQQINSLKRELNMLKSPSFQSHRPTYPQSLSEKISLSVEEKDTTNHHGDATKVLMARVDAAIAASPSKLSEHIALSTSSPALLPERSCNCYCHNQPLASDPDKAFIIP